MSFFFPRTSRFISSYIQRSVVVLRAQSSPGIFTLGLHIFARFITNADVYSIKNNILTNIVKEITPNRSQRKA